MDQAPTIEDLNDRVQRVFKPERLGSVLLETWTLVIYVRTDRYERISVAELVRLAEVLDVGVEAISLWDVKHDGGGVEIWVDTDPTTPIAKPPMPVAGRPA